MFWEHPSIRLDCLNPHSHSTVASVATLGIRRATIETFTRITTFFSNTNHKVRLAVWANLGMRLGCRLTNDWLIHKAASIFNQWTSSLPLTNHRRFSWAKAIASEVKSPDVTMIILLARLSIITPYISLKTWTPTFLAFQCLHCTRLNSPSLVNQISTPPSACFEKDCLTS